MNYLAHCYFAQPTPQSLYGNLLGDFIAGADLQNLTDEAKLGLENHRLVDRVTDAHEALQPLKSVISKERRRFLGIIADVVFDYFLILHWSEFTDENLDKFVNSRYEMIEFVIPEMHPRMSKAMQYMLDQNGLLFNKDLKGVSTTLDRLSRRIRFENNLSGAIEEVEEHYELFESAFLELFPDVEKEIKDANIESKIK